MTPQQKAICRELLALAYKAGFGCYYPLAPIAAKLGIKRRLYDNNTNTGLLWNLGKHGSGLLDITTDGTAACVPYELKDEVARYSGFKGI